MKPSFASTLPVSTNEQENRARREQIAKHYGGQLVCGQIVAPQDQFGVHNTLAALDEVNALAQQIAARRGRK